MEVIGEFTTTLTKALDEIDSGWRDYEGLVVAGTHTPQNTEEMINLIKVAREEKMPALLVCFGYQLGCIEYNRNVKGIKDATSEEFGKGTFVVKKRDKLKVGWHDGESWWSNYEAEDWPIPDSFTAVPYHPEYQSTPDRPHPILIQFLNYAKDYSKNEI